MTPAAIDQANATAFERLTTADPILLDVRPAGEVVPGFHRSLVLTSGAPLPWGQYLGGQRSALIGGALYQGLAGDPEEAAAKFADGTIAIGGCHDYGCVGSVAGIYTASMPVLVVENRTAGNRAFCNLYEGRARHRLNYGVYNEEVATRLATLRDVVGPVIGAAVRAQGSVSLKPIIARALHMGDELHSRNTAASYLFADQLFPAIVDLLHQRILDHAAVKRVLAVLTEDNYFFLRLSMAAAKATADAARHVDGSTVVTAMAVNCREFAIRVSGLGDEWFRGSHCDLSGAKFFDGHTAADVAWMGGESVITECVGLGAFAQAAAFPLQAYQGGSPEAMIASNLAMYQVAVGEHPDYKIPYFQYRGTPTGIDIRKVVATGVLPIIDAGLGGRDGGQIGAGVIRTPMDCYQKALHAFEAKYGRAP